MPATACSSLNALFVMKGLGCRAVICAELKFAPLLCRPLHFSDSSDGSRCNSLNNKMGAATTIVELQGLNELLFGAIQVLCQQPGAFHYIMSQ